MQVFSAPSASISSSPTLLEEKKDALSSEADQKLIMLAFQNDISSIKNYLNESNPNILALRDKRDYTLLHIACLNNQMDLFNIIFDYLKFFNNSNEKGKEYDFSDWINSKTDEGFTALHFASFRGNIKMIEFLEANGADYTTLNNQGLNVLHIASQGDQPVSLAYFHEKPNMDINGLDKKGSTPLHWAAYLGCENSVNYLTIKGGEINLPDEEGKLTPLHLAVISGNSRVVRKLLIKGADRFIRDKNNKTPMDLAKDNEYNNIMGLLQDQKGFATFYNIKPTFNPNRKKKRSLLLFFGFFFGISVLFYIFCYPYVNNNIFPIINLVLFALALVFFLFSWLKDPGYIQKKKNYSLIDLLRDNESSNVCLDCEIIKPPRSKHCEICHTCVSVYDHHCPWINNCVGMSNHRYFLSFVFSVWLYIISVIVVILLHFCKSHDDLHFYYIYDMGIDYDHLFIVKIVVSSLSLFFAAGFVLPLTILLWIQLNNFLLNKTTSERYGYNKTMQTRSESSETNSSVLNHLNMQKRKNQNLKNFLAMCCGNSRNESYAYASLKSVNLKAEDDSA